MFNRIGLVVKDSTAATNKLLELTAYLSQRGIAFVVESGAAQRAGLPGFAQELSELATSCDLIVSLGGDGTLLALARELLSKVPVLAVNLGRLGFVTEINDTDSGPVLERVLAGEYQTCRRILLQGEVIRDGAIMSSFRALNEVLVCRDAYARILQLDLLINGARVTTYSADGLIVATPTGSTAHSLSAGGPLVHPDMEVMVLTPVCPHTLSNRPLVIPASDLVELSFKEQNDVLLVADGQVSIPLCAGDKVRIVRSGCDLNLIMNPDRSFYQVLRSKLYWRGS